jgi:hypothetical protein
LPGVIYMHFTRSNAPRSAQFRVQQWFHKKSNPVAVFQLPVLAQFQLERA